MAVTKFTRDGKRFELRTGLGGLKWHGHYRDGDPGSVPPDHLRLLVNGNIRNGAIEARGGQEKFTGSALLGCPRLIHDFPCVPNTRLYMVADGCPDISTSVGFSVAHYDYEQEPQFQRGIYYDGSTTNAVLGLFDSGIWVGVDAHLKQIVLIQVPHGRENLGMSGGSQDRPLKTFSGFIIRALQAFDGRLYIFLDGGAGTSKTVAYDGVTFIDDDTSTQIVTGAGLYRDLLIAGHATAVGKIRYRVKGDPPGTWADVSTAGAGFVGRGVSYKDKFYMADGSTQVWVYDGTTLASSTTIAGATITDLEKANGFLYAVYTNAGAGRIARFDGSSWTAIHKDLTAQVATINGARKIAWYRDALYAHVTTTVPGNLLYRSPGSSTSGTWELVPTGAFTNVNDINQFLVAP